MRILEAVEYFALGFVVGALVMGLVMLYMVGGLTP